MTIRPIGDYATIVFDCDGVILNSNHIKTDAFFKAACPLYGEQAAERLVHYHVANGGISRFEKFDYLLSNIVNVESTDERLRPLLDEFARQVHEGLMTCDIAPGLSELRTQYPEARWLVVSGGAEAELREVFAQRHIDLMFDGGIFGSPEDKINILSREIASGNIASPSIFFGDSRYDHVAAAAVGMDFLFFRGWSEFVEWPTYCAEHKLPIRHSLRDLL